MSELESTTQETGDTTMPKFHELADAFPLITGEAYDELKADLEKHGQLEPVVMFEGKILDGRNRWRAMQDLGMPHREVKLDEGVDPVAYVWSKNAVRRQLTPAQKALAATKLVTVKLGDNQHTSDEKTSNADAAALAGVGERSVQRARRVLDNAAPEVVTAVEEGELGLRAAETLSEQPKETQTEIMKGGAKKAAKVATAVRESEDDESTDVGPEVLLLRSMKSTYRVSTAARTKLWAETPELIEKLDPALVKKFVSDLTAERTATDQLLKLIKTQTGTATTPRSGGTTKGADVPTEAPKAAAKKTAARKPAAPRKAPVARKTAAKKTAAAPETPAVPEPEFSHPVNELTK